MLLRNYFNWRYNFQHKYIQYLCGGSGDYESTIKADSSMGLTRMAVADTYTYLRIQRYTTDGTGVEQIPTNYVFNRNITACVGSGTTEVSVEDTALANSLSGVTCAISSTTYENTEDFKIKTLYVITGTNNSSESVTINEVGLCKQFYAGENSNTTLRFSSNKYLMARQLLETPIIVPAGKEYRITLEVIDDLALTQN